MNWKSTDVRVLVRSVSSQARVGGWVNTLWGAARRYDKFFNRFRGAPARNKEFGNVLSVSVYSVKLGHTYL